MVLQLATRRSWSTVRPPILVSLRRDCWRGRASPTYGPLSAAIWEMIDSTEQPNEHLEKIAQEAVEETRMVLPGIQGS